MNSWPLTTKTVEIRKGQAILTSIINLIVLSINNEEEKQLEQRNPLVNFFSTEMFLGWLIFH